MSKREKTLEEFLAPISVALDHSTVPRAIDLFDTQTRMRPHVTDGLSRNELVERFAAESRAIRIEMSSCTRKTLADTLFDLVEENAAGKVLITDDERMDALGVASKLDAAENVELTRWDATRSRDESIGIASFANIGITFASAGIAETGTIVQPCSARCGRSISLLPAVHIAVVEKASIVASMNDALQQLNTDRTEDAPEMPSQVCFISGPSNTSDIELVRVDGVHGPTKVCYVLLDD